MRKLIVVLMFFIVSFEGFSSNDTKGTVIIYREHNSYGSAVSFKIFANDSLIIKIRNNTYFIYECIPGDINFKLNNIEDTNVKLNIEKGETYYLRVGLRTGFWSSVPEILLVDSISAFETVNSGKMKKLTNLNEILSRPKARMGLELSVGGGNESVPLITMEDGEEAEISFGGGIGVGFTTGYEVNKYLDLSFNVNYKSSSLVPYVDNAEISFSRVNIRLTPALILPIDGGYSMRLKLGAGLDYYTATNLEFQTEEIPGGFNEIWEYENSLGSHATITFELDPTEKWTISYGFNFYNVKYKFEQSDQYYPLDTKLIDPVGSGFELLMGIYYNF